MPRKKLFRIQEALILPNILQHDNPEVKKIISEFATESTKTFLELGCGRGEYTFGLGKMFPKAHCMGMDIQGERMWHGAKKALDEKIFNILFVRGQIEHICEYIPDHSIDEIWIPFPDPFLREKKAKKRLTGPRFLEMYTKILKKNGRVHLKTDNHILYEFSKETIQNFGAKILEMDENLLLSQDSHNPLSIQTQYEKRYRSEGKNIFYLCFEL